MIGDKNYHVKSNRATRHCYTYVGYNRFRPTPLAACLAVAVSLNEVLLKFYTH